MVVARVARLLLASAAFFIAPVDASARTSAKTEPRILLQADEVTYDSGNAIVSAQGHVEIDDQGRILMADKVVYEQNSDKVTAIGHVSLADEKGNVSFGNQVVLTDRMRDGVLAGFGALIGKNGRLAAVSAQRVAGTKVIGHKSVYSPCKICNQPGHRTPLWQVKSERVVYDQSRHRIDFARATIDFYGVPVLYTPYLSVPDPTVHHASGLLEPQVGSTATTGYYLRAPVYVAFSDSADMTIAPMRSLNNDDMVSVEYRQRWNNGGLWFQGSGAYNPNGGLGGAGPQTYGNLFGSGRIALDDANSWRAGFDLQLTSNNAYMQDFDISPLDRLVNDIFLEKDSGLSRFLISGYYFQGLRATDNAKLIPYALPEVDYNYIPRGDVLGGQFRLNINSAVLGQTLGPDSQRLTEEVSWRDPLVLANGQIWTVQADLRSDLYHIDNDGMDMGDYPTVPTGSHYYSRAIPYLALDWRWPFLASDGSGRSYILEPIAQVVAQPYGGNLTGLPIEDSTAFELDDNNIFSFNPLPGYDLVESGPRANYGFMAETVFAGGEAQAEIGQSYRLKTDPILDAYTGDDGTSSDVVGRVTVTFPHFSLTDRADLDRDDGSLERNELTFKTSYGRSSLQVNYLQLPPSTATGLGLQEQVTVQADINLFGNWQVFSAVQQNVLTGQLLNTEYALGYQNDCFGLALGYRFRYTSDLQQGIPQSADLVFGFTIQTDGEAIQPSKLFPDNVFQPVIR
jgi:LPS-assembly protein